MLQYGRLILSQKPSLFSFLNDIRSIRNIGVHIDFYVKFYVSPAWFNTGTRKSFQLNMDPFSEFIHQVIGEIVIKICNRNYRFGIIQTAEFYIQRKMFGYIYVIIQAGGDAWF